jgi:hypothetical protein
VLSNAFLVLLCVIIFLLLLAIRSAYKTNREEVRPRVALCIICIAIFVVMVNLK